MFPLNCNLNDYCRVLFVEHYESGEAEDREFLLDILYKRNNVEDIEQWFGNILIEMKLDLIMRAAILNSMNFDDIHSDIIDALGVEELLEYESKIDRDEKICPISIPPL